MTTTITEDEISERLHRYRGSTTGRELVKNERDDGYEKTGSVVYSLQGSPPKGYAVVIPGHTLVCFYDSRGECFDRLEETVVAEVEQ